MFCKMVSERGTRKVLRKACHRKLACHCHYLRIICYCNYSVFIYFFKPSKLQELIMLSACALKYLYLQEKLLVFHHLGVDIVITSFYLYSENLFSKS